MKNLIKNEWQSRLVNFKSITFLFISLVVLNACDNSEQKGEDENKIIGEYVADLTFAPNVPSHANYDHPEKVVVKLEVIEKVMRLADGVDYTFWTFGGRVPGKFIRITVGDEVEFHLSNNPNNKMPHNIDLHAVNGPGGGASASLTVPGHTSVFSFKALNSGIFVYHCATAPVGMHIANGMYGLILVEPKGGLPKVDKEFYIMQGDMYTKGKFGEAGLQSFDMDKALKEEPDYVVFNGSVGANSGDNALQVKVGETVRLFVGNGGPNLVSSFHVIGEIFDKVYVDGGQMINRNVQTTLIPSGGAAIVEFKCDVPGTLNIVDHSIFRAFNKGALAQIKVSGDPDLVIYSGKQFDEVYQPEGSAVQEIISTPVKEVNLFPARTKEERMSLGQNLYNANCAACHMKDGNGLPGAFPSLLNSDFLKAREDKGINIPLKGLTGKIKVNGKEFDGVMPAVSLTDDELANILTYVHNTFTKTGSVITSEDVNKQRTGKK